MLPDVRAELVVQLRRPAHWLLLVTGVALTVTFGYVIPYGAGTDTGPGGTSDLPRLLPAELTGAAIAGLPVFEGALAVIFGVLLVGSEYAWGTWKTVLVRQPSRTAALGAKLVVLAVGALVLVLALTLGTMAASMVIAFAEDAPRGLPSAGDAVRDVGAGWLIATVWALFGAALSVVLRAVALPVGIGLVWMLAVQNLISGVAAPLIDWVDDAQELLPGPAAGSLVATLTGRTDTPGVTELSSASQAVFVLCCYGVAFIGVSGILLRRRDLG